MASRENIEEAVENLYGGFANLYDNHVILKDIDDNYPDFLSQGNLTSVLEAAKRKKNSS